MLLYPRDTAFRLILIDFTMAVSISYCRERRRAWAFAEDVCLYNCLDEELDRETYLEWLDTERGKLLEQLAKKNRDELERFYESLILGSSESPSDESDDAYDSTEEVKSPIVSAVDIPKDLKSPERAAKPERLTLAEKEASAGDEQCLEANLLKVTSSDSGVSPTSSTGSAKRSAELAFEDTEFSMPDERSPKRPAIASPEYSPRRLRSASRRCGADALSTKK